MVDNIIDILNKFEPISLKEMDSVSLLDRIDTKFMFRIDKLPLFLEKISPLYRVLDIKNIRINNYETLYYDTDDFFLFLQHHNGKLNRYKVRNRRYVDTNLNFFEIKFKNNKNRTIKRRIKRENLDIVLKDDAKDFLVNNSNLNPESLSAKLWVNYSRITLVNKFSKERLTIDLNLNFRNENSTISYPMLVITEVKQDKANRSNFLSLMKENHIRPNSISKYCFGLASIQQNIKKNNFKYKILTINKICYGKD